jgi:hypothetical protein
MTVLKINTFYICRAVDIATGYELDDRGVGARVPAESTIFTSPYRPDRLWGEPNSIGGSLSGGKANAT